MTFGDRVHFSKTKYHHWKQKFDLLTFPLQTMSWQTMPAVYHAFYLFFHIHTFTLILEANAIEHNIAKEYNLMRYRALLYC